MKYGIKLKPTIGLGGQFLQSAPRSVLSEHEGADSMKVLEFDTISEAEVYAQDHELKNYTIEPVYDLFRVFDPGQEKGCACGGNCGCND